MTIFTSAIASIFIFLSGCLFILMIVSQG